MEIQHDISFYKVLFRTKIYSLKYAWFCIILCFATIFPNHGMSQDTQKHNKKESYQFGVLSLNHPIVMYRQYLPFVEYINQQTPWQINLVVYKNYDDVIQALQNGQLDIALVAGNTFLQARKVVQLDPLLSILSEDGTTDTYTVFVCRDNEKDNNVKQHFSSIEDLKNKTIAFGSRHSTASYTMPLYYLAKKNIFLDDFAKTLHFDTHDGVARAVLRGDADAGAINVALAQRFLGQGLRVFGTTKPFPGFLIVARNGVPKKVRSALQSILLAVQPQSEPFITLCKTWPDILRYGFSHVDASRYDVFLEFDASMKDLLAKHMQDITMDYPNIVQENP